MHGCAKARLRASKLMYMYMYMHTDMRACIVCEPFHVNVLSHCFLTQPARQERVGSGELNNLLTGKFITVIAWLSSSSLSSSTSSWSFSSMSTSLSSCGYRCHQIPHNIVRARNDEWED